MKRFLVAEMWWCGDEVCDCTQPQINERSTGHWRNPEWKPIKCIADGPFHADTCSLSQEERKSQWDWLLENARKFQVVNLSEVEEQFAELYGAV